MTRHRAVLLLAAGVLRLECRSSILLYAVDDGSAVLHRGLTVLNPAQHTAEPLVVTVAAIALTLEGTGEDHILQVVHLLGLSENTAGSQVAVVAGPCGNDVHVNQHVGDGGTERILAESGHAVSVTHQRTGQPEVTDLGAFAHAAEESAHTLTAAAGIAVQVGGNGNLVILCIERTGEGRTVIGAANQAVALGTVGCVVDVGSHHGTGAEVSAINQLRKCIQVRCVLNHIGPVRSRGQSPGIYPGEEQREKCKNT